MCVTVNSLPLLYNIGLLYFSLVLLFFLYSRIFPLVIGTSRTLDKEIILDNYVIPKNVSMLLICIYGELC